MFTSLKRKLPYPLYEGLAVEATTPDEPIDCDTLPFPEDPEERISLVINLSADELVVLASAIDVGSDIAYGRDAVQVWWLWTRIFMCATFCEQVIDCIENDEATQAALNTFIINQVNNNVSLQQALSDNLSRQSASGQPITGSSASETLLPDDIAPEGICNLARMGAGMEYLVEYLDTLITDFFQVMAEFDATAKIVAKAAGLIPVVGQYAESGVEFYIAVREKLALTYAGEQSEEVKFEIAQAFFCKAKEGCSFSIEDAIAVIVERLGTLEPGEFGAIITSIVEGTFTGVQIVDTAYLLGLAALKFGGKFGDAVGVRPFAQLIAYGSGTPNDYWTTYDGCPDETGWSSERDLMLSDGGLYIPDDFTPYDAGLWVDGTGWTSQNVLGSQILTVALTIPMTAGSTLTGVAIDFVLTGGASGNSAIYIGSFAGNNLEAGAGTYTDQSVAFSVDLSSGDIEVIIRLDRIAGDSVLTRARYFGEGIDPFA